MTIFGLFAKRSAARKAKADKGVKRADASIKKQGKRTVQLKPGLSHKAAYRAASAEIARAEPAFDFRGMSYDVKTGKAVLT